VISWFQAFAFHKRVTVAPLRRGTHKIFYERLAKKHMRGLMDKTGRDYCTLDIAVDGVVEGQLMVELFTDVVGAVQVDNSVYP
jgi:hypothetical protein